RTVACSGWIRTRAPVAFSASKAMIAGDRAAARLAHRRDLMDRNADRSVRAAISMNRLRTMVHRRASCLVAVMIVLVRRPRKTSVRRPRKTSVRRRKKTSAAALDASVVRRNHHRTLIADGRPTGTPDLRPIFNAGLSRTSIVDRLLKARRRDRSTAAAALIAVHSVHPTRDRAAISAAFLRAQDSTGARHANAPLTFNAAAAASASGKPCAFS